MRQQDLLPSKTIVGQKYTNTLKHLRLHETYTTKFNDVHYFLKSKTNTVPSDADAPTLSPRLFQQTSKMPPVPL